MIGNYGLNFQRIAPWLATGGVLFSIAAAPSYGGPVVRHIQERKACQQFAEKLEAASGNPQQAQLIYQQGVLKLVAKFGTNPCGDIPVPTAIVPGTPAAPTLKLAGVPAVSPSAQQLDACKTFASKLSAASASGGTGQAKQVYVMGLDKLTGMFGPNPCPGVVAP